MAEHAACVLHFSNVKGPLLNFTEKTFAKFIESRKAWLKIQSKEQGRVALDSLQFVNDDGSVVGASSRRPRPRSLVL